MENVNYVPMKRDIKAERPRDNTEIKRDDLYYKYKHKLLVMYKKRWMLKIVVENTEGKM
jgi:hypothetical protein